MNLSTMRPAYVASPTGIEFLFFFTLLFLGSSLSAQTIWGGSASSDWNDTNNWSAGVPDAADNVTIPDVTANDPVIMGGTNAFAKSVKVEVGGSLTINAAASLVINGFSLQSGTTFGFYNEGTVTNNGAIVLGSIASVGEWGIWNKAMFNNLPGGEISIDRSISHGLYNQTGTFNNAAKITIGSVASIGGFGLGNFMATFNNNTGGEISIDRSSSQGMYTYGPFNNAAKITIGAVAGVGQGIGVNDNTFNNNTGGEISIDRSTSIGLYNRGTLNNFAKITIGAVASTGRYGLRNDFIFNNNTGGEINMGHSTDASIYNLFGTFNNAAKITIGEVASTGYSGIENRATFNNNTGGEIKIDRTTFYGVYNLPGTFNNSAKITIGAVASAGIYGIWNNSTATFNNNAGGEINIDSTTNSGLVYGVVFNNSAKITVGAVANVGPNGISISGTFNNNIGGEISIDRSTSFGLLNSFNSFTNAAKITIGALAGVEGYGLRNSGTFNNSACALLYMSAPIFNTTPFINSGLFTVNSVGVHSNNALTNNGVIVYPQGNPILNVTNNDLIVASISEICSVPGALQIGSANNFAVSNIWYLDEALTDPAGTYDPVTNIFSGNGLPQGTTTLYLVVTDQSNNCTQTVHLSYTFEDATPPTLVCKSGAVFLDETGNYTLLITDVFDAAASDNCSGTLMVTNISPASVSCNHVNQTIPVTVTVQYDIGNTASCTTQITVQEGTTLPGGWSNENVGNANGNAINKPCSSGSQYTINATGFSTSSSDVLHLTARQLCGNGEIIARVASVSGGGWAGITLRESLAQGSKVVALKTQGNGNIRRMIRTTTNGATNNSNYARPQHNWLRLVRSGSNFTGYTSTDGSNWIFAFSATVSMTGCIYAGLFAESINNTVTTTAVFDNVTVTGAIAPLVAPENPAATVAVPDFEVYPNPTTGEVTINLKAYANRAVRLEVYDAQGKVLKVMEVDAAEIDAQRIDLSDCQNGIYLIRAQSDGVPDATKRVLVIGLK